MAKNQPTNVNTQVGICNGNTEGYATAPDIAAIIEPHLTPAGGATVSTAAPVTGDGSAGSPVGFAPTAATAADIAAINDATDTVVANIDGVGWRSVPIADLPGGGGGGAVGLTDIGSYIEAGLAGQLGTSGTAPVLAGDTIAGTGLVFYASGTSIQTNVGVGTWRAHGHASQYNLAVLNVTLWQRIA